MNNREQKQERLQQLQTELNKRREYLGSLNDFAQRHKLEFVPGKGYIPQPKEKKAAAIEDIFNISSTEDVKE